METVLMERLKNVVTSVLSDDLDVSSALMLAFFWRYSKTKVLLLFTDVFASEYELKKN